MSKNFKADFVKHIAESLVPEDTRRIKLKKFLLEGWHTIEPATQFMQKWHIDLICDHLEAVATGDIKNLLINIAPRCCKSILCSIMFPAWMWTFKPETRFICASYGQNLSLDLSRKCKKVVESDWYDSHWNKVSRLQKNISRMDFYETTRSGYRLATTVGSETLGRGGDYIIIDDPHHGEDWVSKARRESTIRWWETTISTRINNFNNGGFIIVNQRIHQEDLSAYLLEHLKGVGIEHLKIPMEYEPKIFVSTKLGWKDPRTTPGELLWPERIPKVYLDSKKRGVSNLHLYNTQYQQEPAPPDGDLVKKEWWNFYVDVPVDIKGHMDFDEIIQSWDLATGKDTSRNSYTVGQVWGRKGASKFLLDQVRGRYTYPKARQAIISMTEKWPMASLKLIEDKSAGESVIQDLEHVISGIVPVKTPAGKLSRLHAVLPQIEAGNIYLPKNAYYTQDFIEEFCMVTSESVGKFSDQIDAATQALTRLNRPKRGLTWGRNETKRTESKSTYAKRSLTFGRTRVKVGKKFTTVR